MSTEKKAPVGTALLFAATLLGGSAARADLPALIDAVRPSVVAVGTYQTTRRPPAVFRATGFVVGDGGLVATNNHVIPDNLDEANRERLVIFAGRGKSVDMRSVTVVARDPDHDLWPSFASRASPCEGAQAGQ